MKKQLGTFQSFRPHSALEDFLERTVVHEKAGARMPRILVLYALLGAAVTAGIGALGIVATRDSASEFADFINTFSWIAAGFGGLLLVTAICLSQARSAESRPLMQDQLIAGAILPGIVLALGALCLLIFVAIVWVVFMMIWELINP